MAKEDPKRLFSKVAKFVRNPLKDWSELDDAADTAAPETGYSREMLKEMIERRQRNDFVRRREFDMLRKMRRREAAGDRDAAAPVSVDSTSGKNDGRALTLKKIDEIEEQMSQQWWKGRPPGAPGEQPAGGWQRDFYATSSCGICGKQSIEAVRAAAAVVPDGPQVTSATLSALPDALRAEQRVFERTGGLHAAALFTAAGDLIAVREDVGRHNAVDKLVGRAAMDGLLPLHDHVLMVSGRVSFEIVQKALAAGFPVVAAVSAPSSLAVRLASESNMTLVGFLRADAFNVYAGADRVALCAFARGGRINIYTHGWRVTP